MIVIRHEIGPIRAAAEAAAAARLPSCRTWRVSQCRHLNEDCNRAIKSILFIRCAIVNCYSRETTLTCGTKTYKSDIKAAIHQTMSDLYEAGMLDKQTMR